MMDAKLRPESFKDLVKHSCDDRQKVREIVEKGVPIDAEPDTKRVKAFNARVERRRGRTGAEAKQGNTNDLQQVSFLVEGALVSRTVGFVEVNDTRESAVGSGFLISPKLFITNWHVIKDINAAHASQVTFDREMGFNGRPRPSTSFIFDPGRFALFSSQDELDYAVIAIGERNSGAAELKELGFLPISNSPDRHVLGMNVNIIQHPDGLPKMVSIRNNLLTARGRDQRTLLYETDTEAGSSGSPVFNDLWDVVALHHWGEPFLEHFAEDGTPLSVNVNEGVRISAIYQDLQKRLGDLPSTWQTLLREALEAAASAEVAGPGRPLGPPRPRRESKIVEITDIDQRESSVGSLAIRKLSFPILKPLNSMNENPEMRFVIPLEVTIRPGAPVCTGAVASAGLSGPIVDSRQPPSNQEGLKPLVRGAEAKKLDKDYTNRRGYDERHIPGHVIELPKISASEIAPLRATEPNATSGVLHYEHFSVVMHKARRIAIFTATNIDGESYLRVDRDTGRVVGAEGETWYKDPRISESFWTGQDFYSAWSSYFDRGHLTRRTDPTWGKPEEAERANADTFHFVNCSPQHFRFNQTTDYWQGAERYILENGILATDVAKPISVFQGPIFDDKIDLYADDLQIPSSFFKVIVWQGAAGLKAVGLVVDQLSLLSESRVNLGEPREVESVQVNQWRVPIAKIEERTGINFGEEVRDADTINEGDQPAVGAEAIRRLRSLDDILR